MPRHAADSVSLWICLPIVLVYGYLLYQFPWLVVIATLIFVLWSYLNAQQLTKRLRSVAALRKDENFQSFAKSFDNQVDAQVIAVVYETLQAELGNLCQQFPLRAEDSLFEFLNLDPDDLDWVIVRKVAHYTGRSAQSLPNNPYYGTVVTVGDLVLYFNAQPFEHHPSELRFSS